MNLRKHTLQALLMILASLIPMPGYAVRHYGFKSLSNGEGISASYVKAIAQDSNGFIWIGTKNGLDRYDGVSIRSFPCIDANTGHGNNNIGAIYEDSQSNLWIGTDRGVYIFSPRTEKFVLMDAVSRNGVKADDWVQTIQGDPGGNVWILIPNQGVFKYHNKELEYYSVTNHNGDKEKQPLSLLVTQSGNVYVGTSGQGIFRFDRQTNSFRRISGKNPSTAPLENVMASFLCELSDGSICMATRLGELVRVVPSTAVFETIPFSKKGKVMVHSMENVDGEMWLGTTEGIYSIDLKKGDEYEISRNTMGSRSLSDNTITSIFIDRDRNVWAGSMFGGLNLIQRTGMIFEKYEYDVSSRSLSSNHVHGLAVDHRGNVWIGTEDAGLDIIDPMSGSVSHLPFDLSDNNITLCLESIGDYIYAGLARGGCLVMKDGKVVDTIGKTLLQTVNDVYSVLEDADGNLWIGASWGLFRRDHGSEIYTKIDELGYAWVFNMLQDSTGKIWIVSMGDGVWAYNPSSEEYMHYAYNEDHTNGMRSNSISSVMEDNKGRLWFSTDRGGLMVYRPETDTFDSYGTESGLPDDTVYDVIEDNLGYLWFGTNRGLVKFNPDTRAVKVFNGPLSQFNYNSALKAPDGRFYMGGIDGLIVFSPEADEQANPDGSVYFTGFRVPGSEIYSAPEDNGLDISIVYTDNINLNSDSGNFSLSIGSPVYSTHNTNSFLYRLLPVNYEWDFVTDPSNLSFAGLAPGDYTLEVKLAGNDASLRRLRITVPCPWYTTWWAWTIYSLIIIGVIAAGAIVYRRRQRRKLMEKENILTIEKEKELYKKKMQFFTELAHEIRTPLTLIGTPLEAIEDIGVKDTRIQRYLRVIRQNTMRLLDLTAQILDFQKMDSESHPLKIETVDITSLTRGIVDRFEVTISTRGKNLICRLPDHQILANVDKDAVTKILSNLVNNALKYSDKLIDITLDVKDDNFEVYVKSDGEKIAGENRYKIFEPFYQTSNKTDNGGVGIGLALCRTLAHLHGGTIELVDDNEPGTNTFRFVLPLKSNDVEPTVDANPVMAEYVMEDESPLISNNSSYSLLLVDDNDEMREFLYDQLSKNFVVETARDGKEALVKLKEHHFDIIVTDIMMPEMDGYELCRAIKDDPSLSPIPVVFLTAKNDLESKVKALECGGESYIEKPFSIKYFRQQIISLLDNRRHERKAFLNKPFFTVDNMKMNKGDEEFMNKAIKMINDNIDNENFNVESMADLFCMSRSNLLRRIKTLFNLSPIELIRIVRLKKAAELIQEGKYRMGDICFMVGINSQSYFTRLFYKQFGITPKAFEKQCREKSQPADSRMIEDVESGE